MPDDSVQITPSKKERVKPSKLLTKLVKLDQLGTPMFYMGTANSHPIFKRLCLEGSGLDPTLGVLSYNFAPGDLKTKASLYKLYRALQTSKSAIIYQHSYPIPPLGALSVSSSYPFEELLDHVDHVAFYMHTFRVAGAANTVPMAFDIFLAYQFGGKARIQKLSYCDMIAPWSKELKTLARDLSRLTARAFKNS